MVFGPMAIFRFSRMAARTSASQTKSAGCIGGGGGSAGEGAGIAELEAPAPEEVSQLNPVFSPADRRERNRSTTSVARCETVPPEAVADAAVIPRADK